MTEGNKGQGHSGSGDNVNGDKITNNYYQSENEQKVSDLNKSFEELITELIENHQKNLQKIAEDSRKVANSLEEVKKTLSSKEAPDKSIKEKRNLLESNISRLSNEVDNIDKIIARNLKSSLEAITENISCKDLNIIDTTISQLNKAANIIESELKKTTDTEEIKLEPINEQTSTNEPHQKTSDIIIRRQFLKYGSCFVGGVLLTVFIPKMRKVKWTMESFLSYNQSNVSILYNVASIVSERVEKLTNGNFTITLTPTSGNDKTTVDILGRIHRGEINCGFTGIYYDDDKYRPLYFASAIPFGLTPQQQTAWLLYKDKENPDDDKLTLTFVQKIYEKLDLNIIAFPAGGTGFQMGGWFKKEINSLEDLQGLKMRIPGLGGEVFDKLGGKSHKFLNDADGNSINYLKLKMEEGDLDAFEWIGPHDDLALGLHQVKGVKYYYYPGWWEPGTILDLQVNKESYNNLPNEYQEILKAVCWETYVETIAEYDLKNPEALKTIEQQGIELKQFSPEILEAAKKATDELLEDYSTDDTFKKVYEKWKEFKNNIQQWHEYGKPHLD